MVVCTYKITIKQIASKETILYYIKIYGVMILVVFEHKLTL